MKPSEPLGSEPRVAEETIAVIMCPHGQADNPQVSYRALQEIV